MGTGNSLDTTLGRRRWNSDIFFGQTQTFEKTKFLSKLYFIETQLIYGFLVQDRDSGSGDVH